MKELIENNQLITTSRIMIKTYEMTMKERFNITGLNKRLLKLVEHHRFSDDYGGNRN